MNEMLKERLEHHLKDELSDVICYNTFAKEAETHREQKLFYAIRNDEYEHAETILAMLKLNGYKIEEHPEVLSLWEKVKEL